jgi:hypothetical protein
MVKSLKKYKNWSEVMTRDHDGKTARLEFEKSKELHDAFGENLAPTYLQALFNKEEDLTFLVHGQGPSHGQGILIHQVKITGGTVTAPKQRMLGLVGSGPTASPVELVVSSFVEATPINAPALSNLLKAKKTSEKPFTALKPTKTSQFMTIGMIPLPKTILAHLVEKDEWAAPKIYENTVQFLLDADKKEQQDTAASPKEKGDAPSATETKAAENKHDGTDNDDEFIEEPLEEAEPEDLEVGKKAKGTEAAKDKGKEKEDKEEEEEEEKEEVTAPGSKKPFKPSSENAALIKFLWAMTVDASHESSSNLRMIRRSRLYPAVDEPASEYSYRLHQLWIEQLAPEASPLYAPGESTHPSMSQALQLLANSQSDLASIVATSAAHPVTAAVPKKDRWNKLPEHKKNSIAFLSSTDGLTPGTVTEAFQEVINTASSIEAQDQIAYILSKAGVASDIPMGMIASLRAGNLEWSDPMIPTNYSVFNCPPNAVGDRASRAIAMQIRLKSEEGKGLSDADIKKIATQQITTPADYHSCLDQLTVYSAIDAALLGPGSLLHDTLRGFIKFVKKNRKSLEAQHLTDVDFFTKLLFLVDNRRNILFGQAVTATDVSDIEWQMIYSEVAFDSILSRQFNINLPEVLRRTAPHRPAAKSTTPKQSPSPADQDSRKRNSSGRDERDQSGAPVSNKNQHREWALKPGESFPSVFRIHGKLASQLCMNFHIKGACREDCPRAASHKILQGDDNKAMSKLVTTARAAAAAARD